MDGVKGFFRGLKKYHFWVLSVILLVAALVVWWSQSSSLAAYFTEQESQIKSQFTTIDGVRTFPNHPNAQYIEEQAIRVGQRRSGIQVAWQEKWDRQKDVLKWPDELQEALLDKVKKLSEVPFERYDFDEKDADKKLVRFLRQDYQNYIKKELPKLAERIGSKWQVNLAGTIGGASEYGGEGYGSSGYGESPYGDATGGGGSYPYGGGYGAEGGGGYDAYESGGGAGSYPYGGGGGYGAEGGGGYDAYESGGGAGSYPYGGEGYGGEGAYGAEGYGEGYGSGGYGEGYGAEGGGGYPYGGGGDVFGSGGGDESIIVRWSPSNQKHIQDSRFNWAHSPDGAPTTLEILYAQEDLWVLQSIMDVIKNTNGDVSDHSRAKIKEIQTLDIGRDAVGQRGKISSGSSAIGGAAPTSTDPYAAAEGAGGGGYSDAVGRPPSADGGVGGGDYTAAYGAGYGGSMAPVAPDPQENRYVNKDFESISATDLREMAQTAEGETAYLAVAKRMPVRMRFKMDYRTINKLLVECANSRLPIEIKQLRFNPPKQASTYGSASVYGGYGGGGGGYGDYGEGAGAGGAAGAYPYGGGGGGGDAVPGASSGYGDEMGRGGGVGGYESGYGASNPYGAVMGGGFGGNRLGRSSIKMADSFDRPVEIYGIIYIFNPVDASKLGEEGDEGSDADDSLDPEDTSGPII